MKKFILIILTAFILLSLCACSKKAPEAEPEKIITLSTKELADAVLESVSFPAMTEHVSQSDIETFTGADFAYIEEITCFQQALTVHLLEVIIIKPKDGEMEAVMDFLETRQKKLKEELAFYPSQLTSAEAMVIGNKYNIAYLICHDDAAVAEQTLTKQLTMDN